MRNLISLTLTLVGLFSLYLFASGALAPQDGGRSLKVLLEAATQPFGNADSFALLILSLGVFSFAAGVVISPKSVVLTSSKNPEGTEKEKNLHLKQNEKHRERLLELALVINVCVVAALLILLSYSIVKKNPAPPTTLGTIFFIACLQVFMGIVIGFILLKVKRSWKQRRSPVFLFSSSLNVVEAIFLITVLALGYL